MVGETIELDGVEFEKERIKSLIDEFEAQGIESGSGLGVHEDGYVLYDDGFDDNDVIVTDLQSGGKDAIMSFNVLKEEITDPLDEFALAFSDSIMPQAYEHLVVEDAGESFDGDVHAYVTQLDMNDGQTSTNVKGVSNPFDIAEVDGRKLRYTGVVTSESDEYPDDFGGEPAMFFLYGPKTETLEIVE